MQMDSFICFKSQLLFEQHLFEKLLLWLRTTSLLDNNPEIYSLWSTGPEVGDSF